MSSIQSTRNISRADFKMLDDILENAGMKHFTNDKEQAIRTRAARHLIEQFQRNNERL